MISLSVSFMVLGTQQDFALGLDFALRLWGPSLKIKKKEKINKVASSTYWISAHRCGNGAYDLYQTVFGFFGLVDVPEVATGLQGPPWCCHDSRSTL